MIDYFNKNFTEYKERFASRGKYLCLFILILKMLPTKNIIRDESSIVGCKLDFYTIDNLEYSLIVSNSLGYSQILLQIFGYSHITPDTYGYSQILLDTLEQTRTLSESLDTLGYSGTLTDTLGHSGTLLDSRHSRALSGHSLVDSWYSQTLWDTL